MGGGPAAEVRRRLDELAAQATVSPIDRAVDGWHAKAAPDLPFRRCNAVLPPVGVAGDEEALDRTIAELESWYAGLDQRVIVVISSADPGADGLDRFLAERGYASEAPVHVFTRDLGPSGITVPPAVPPAAVRGGAPAPDVVVADGIDELWATRYASAHGGDRAARNRTEAYGRMLDVLGPSAIGVSASIEGEPAGVGFGVLDSGWVGIFGMGTSPVRRRRGVATAVLDALLARATSRGATAAYLQVETDNHAAIDLYRGLGFAPSHGYHYRVSAPPPS